MAYLLQFRVPDHRTGDPTAYDTLNNCMQSFIAAQGKPGSNIKEVWAISGSVVGQVEIEAPNYLGALGIAKNMAPIFETDWALNEVIDPSRLRSVLGNGTPALPAAPRVQSRPATTGTTATRVRPSRAKTATGTQARRR